MCDICMPKAPSDDALRSDLAAAKAYGMNTIRLHQKVCIMYYVYILYYVGLYIYTVLCIIPHILHTRQDARTAHPHCTLTTVHAHSPLYATTPLIHSRSLLSLHYSGQSCPLVLLRRHSRAARHPGGHVARCVIDATFPA
jgi:hypothetical protein